MKNMTLNLLIVMALALITTTVAAQTPPPPPTAEAPAVIGQPAPDFAPAPATEPPYGPSGTHPMDSRGASECAAPGGVCNLLPSGPFGLGLIVAAMVGMVYLTRRRPQNTK